MSPSAPAARTPFDRTVALGRLGAEEFDVLVVGGGVTGAGVALDAAARGLRTAIVERADWASGTSSRSSKLVHGGLRYLQQKEYRLVAENLAERQHLLENASHLVRPLPFLVPLFGRGGVANRTVAKAYSSALWLYDLAGGWRIGERHRRISLAEALAHFPTLRPERLVAGFVYPDAQADDARLTLALVRTAVLDHGAVAANHVAVESLAKDASGKVSGARLALGGGAFLDVRAKAVVNAAGVWADAVRALDEGPASAALRPAKGVHVTVPWSKLRCDIAAVLPVPADKRSIFVIPWGDVAYVGTTDTDYSGPLDDPRCTPEDVAYVLGAVNAFVTEALTPADVLATWAGLRPLVAEVGTGDGSAKDGRANDDRAKDAGATADLSRRHAVTASAAGVVSVTGGKLTTYRKMAADAVDEVGRVLGRRLRRSPTKDLLLRGAAGAAALREPGAASRFGLPPVVLAHLVGRYGDEARTVAAMLEADPELARPLVAGLPYLRAEAVYAVRYEMARSLDDVLARRTRALILARDATAAAADGVARLVAPELGWTQEESARQAAAFRAAAAAEREAAGLPETAALVFATDGGRPGRASGLDVPSAATNGDGVDAFAPAARRA